MSKSGMVLVSLIIILPCSVSTNWFENLIQLIFWLIHLDSWQFIHSTTSGIRGTKESSIDLFVESISNKYYKFLMIISICLICILQFL